MRDMMTILQINRVDLTLVLTLARNCFDHRCNVACSVHEVLLEWDRVQ